MSTSKLKNFSIAPYYDDFDETKNYHRILYRPGFSVQARELTQMQTALQAQIDRLGQYTFKDGSRVLNGKVTLNVEYDFIKVESSFTHNSQNFNADNYLDEFVGKTITGTAQSGNQVQAKVLQAIPAEGSDPNTLYVKYTSKGGPNRTIEKFVPGEVVSSDAVVPRFGKVGGGSGSTISNPIGQGSIAHIEQGVYFISGTFVYVEEQSLILDKYTNTPSYIIALEVTESIIDSSIDSSLVDNAQGVPNTSAPGANRYKIGTKLVKQSTNLFNRNIENYITLLEVSGGFIKIDTTDKNFDTELTTRLARRTFEQAGNYSVRPFVLDINEHLNDGTNNGLFTSAQGGDSNKLAIGVEPSVAYVQGFRHENTSTSFVEVDKPRGSDATAFVNNAAVGIRVGNYVRLNKNGLKGSPFGANISHYSIINLRNASNQNIGTARARGLELFGDHARLYLFDVVMNAGQTFTNVAKVHQAGTPQAFVGDLNPVGVRFEAGQNTSVFKLPYDAIDSLLTDQGTDTIYQIRQQFFRDVVNNQFTIETEPGRFVTTNDIIVSAGTADLIKPSEISGGIIGNPDGQASITFDAAALSIPNGTAVKVIATVERNLFQKAKTRQNNVTKTINVTNGNQLLYGLEKSDIIRIVSILDSNGTNITNQFTLDNGQRDNFYEEGSIIKSSPQPIALGNMIVTFDHYLHGAGDYFSVDSYPVGDYETIPQFLSSQGLVELRDCIDFRPTKAASGSTPGSEFNTGSDISFSFPVKPSHLLRADITHYLPRIDKLYVTRKGEFKIAVGVPDENPKAPKDPEDSMVIYKLSYKPYVFTLDDVKAEIIDNKRYTMRDIGSIDRRVKNLEYYTSLSLLEQSVADTQLFDGLGFRFKNGFLVDGFRGHNVGDVTNPDYSVAIDKANGVLRPKFDERNVNLVRRSNDTGTATLNNSIVTLPFTQVEYITQPYSSFTENVNPYDVFTWGGVMRLSPSSDEWKEVDRRPDVWIDETGVYDQLVSQLEEEGILGTVWNEWETNWTGINIEDISARGARERVEQTIITQEQSRTGIRTDVVPDTIVKEVGTKLVELNYVPFIRSRRISFRAYMMKPNTQVYPFFNGVRISDFTRMESDFPEYTILTDVKTFDNLTSHPDGATSLITDSKGEITGSFIIPMTANLAFKTGTREFRLTDSPTNNQQEESTFAEAQYHAQGLIEVLQSTVISTKVPRIVQTELFDERTIVDITEQTFPSFFEPGGGTPGGGSFPPAPQPGSGGGIDPSQPVFEQNGAGSGGTIPSSPITRLSQARTIVEVDERRTTEWIDPLAQTFLVSEKGGRFVTSVDLYFATKDESIPVRVSIRTVENGTPTQIIVPGSDVILYPEDVNTSENATVATNFQFDYPVYLEQNQEYAVVIMAQTKGYNVYVAEMGGTDITDPQFRITKQPYNGVFFTSQNSSTWTPEQTKDLKFRLNRAQFTSNTAEINLVNDTIQPRRLRPNAAQTVSGSTEVRILHKNHGMHGIGSRVSISGAIAFNGVDIDGTHTITKIEHDSYVINLPTAANATGSGGGSAIFATENKHMDLMHPIISNIQLPDTDIRYFVSLRSQRSIDGGQAAYGTIPEFEILANTNTQFISPAVIASAVNEQFTNDNKSFRLRCVLSSLNPALSPIIDLERASVVSIQNRTSNATSLENQPSYANYQPETNPTGGSELSKYITRRVDLNEEAEVIKVFLTVNRPNSAAVDLYYKVGDSDDNFGELNWVLAQPIEPIPINDNPNVFTESEYDIEPTSPFSSMKFKIVLRSSNSSTVPRVKDFRAIAAN